MPWRTKVASSRAVEHRSKAAADRIVEESRERYRNGRRTMRLVRVIDPEGNLRIIDLAQEVLLDAPELAQVARAREARDQAQAAAKEATQQWRQAIREARAAGASDADIARAAGTTPAEVRRLSSGR